MIIMCEVCGEREAWSKNLKHPICARCAVLAWEKLSEDAKAPPPRSRLPYRQNRRKGGVKSE